MLDQEMEQMNLRVTSRTHRAVKMGICASGLSSSDFLGMACGSMEGRVSRVKEKYGINELRGGVNELIIQSMFLHDMGELSDEDFEAEMKEIAEVDVSWKAKLEK